MPPFDIMSVVLSTTSLTVVESSSTYFTVMLDNWPGATDLTVTVKFNTSDAGEAIIVPHAVTFGFFDYNVSQTVMVCVAGVHGGASCSRYLLRMVDTITEVLRSNQTMLSAAGHFGMQ